MYEHFIFSRAAQAHLQALNVWISTGKQGSGVGGELDGRTGVAVAFPCLDLKHGVPASDAPGAVDDAVIPAVPRVKDMFEVRPARREPIRKGFPRVGVALECRRDGVGFTGVLGATPAMHLCASLQCRRLHKGAERVSQIQDPSDRPR